MAMIPDLESHFRGLVPPRRDLLRRLEEEAARERIPIVGPVVGELLFILARAMGARDILELGTATAYSTIYLAEAAAAVAGRVISLEWQADMARRARENLVAAGLGQHAEVRLGAAQELLAGMTGPLDLVFMDIDKEGYLPALPEIHRLLRLGGLLVVDNTGFAGAADFNTALRQDERWRSVHLLSFLPQHSPEQDGLALAVKVAA
ncbi:MAG: O-methyltransferase [Desulfobacca sp.]|uniref:O-methyltransferase n=1 Tax=Desulfobacca sp. TaxID=2067990 RepID=UPI00404B70BC